MVTSDSHTQPVYAFARRKYQRAGFGKLWFCHCVNVSTFRMQLVLRHVLKMWPQWWTTRWGRLVIPLLFIVEHTLHGPKDGKLEIQQQEGKMADLLPPSQNSFLNYSEQSLHRKASANHLALGHKKQGFIWTLLDVRFPGTVGCIPWTASLCCIYWNFWLSLQPVCYLRSFY